MPQTVLFEVTGLSPAMVSYLQHHAPDEILVEDRSVTHVERRGDTNILPVSIAINLTIGDGVLVGIAAAWIANALTKFATAFLKANGKPVPINAESIAGHIESQRAAANDGHDRGQIPKLGQEPLQDAG